MWQKILRAALLFLCFALLVYKGELNWVASLVITLIWWSLFLIGQQNATEKNEKYKLEIVLDPEYPELLGHAAVKEYYDKILPIKEHGPGALYSERMRFVILNGIFWHRSHGI